MEVEYEKLLHDFIVFPVFIFENFQSSAELNRGWKNFNGLEKKMVGKHFIKIQTVLA